VNRPTNQTDEKLQPLRTAPAEPKVSVIVPAWNEADELPRTLLVLQCALGELGRAAEIVVVDNASTDGTAEIARAHGAHVVREPERRIALARNAGAAVSRGRFLIFVDADTRPSTELLRASLSLLDSGTVCGGGAQVAFETFDRILYRWGATFWNAIGLRLNLAAGCYVFATREAFNATGGFSERVYAGEEILFSLRMHRWGGRHGQRFRVLREPPVQTSARKAEWFSLWQHLALLALLTLFPFALRSRRLCGFWYRRPGAESKGVRTR
jgi:glycosyltransferase involved in cell wall biosynthesis